MDGITHFLQTTDGTGLFVALLLLVMSVAAWAVIFWKAVVLRRARQDIGLAVAAFWDAPTLEEGRTRLTGMDRERLLVPLIDAALQRPAAGTLAGGGDERAQVTRRLREALHRGLSHLQFGQVLLASIGSTSPFVGLFGTVWGIYHALLAIGSAGSFSIDKVAGPVGEALIMTAAGLAVAIPAVLGYNLFGKWIGQCEAALEGFAHDLRDTVAGPAGPGGASRPEPAPGDTPG